MEKKHIFIPKENSVSVLQDITRYGLHNKAVNMKVSLHGRGGGDPMEYLKVKTKAHDLPNLIPGIDVRERFRNASHGEKIC